MLFQEWKLLYFDWNLIDVFPKSVFDSKSPVVHVMAQRQTGDKP